MFETSEMMIFKNCQLAIFEKKNGNFWQFLGKKWQFFGNFSTFKWQFSGGSDNKIEISPIRAY